VHYVCVCVYVYERERKRIHPAWFENVRLLIIGCVACAAVGDVKKHIHAGSLYRRRCRRAARLVCSESDKCTFTFDIGS
jgi:hypothetical protein